jgi:hypothetical protein
MIFHLLIQEGQYHAVKLSWDGYGLSRLWFHEFEIRHQYTFSSNTFTTIAIYLRNLE